MLLIRLLSLPMRERPGFIHQRAGRRFRRQATCHGLEAGRSNWRAAGIAATITDQRVINEMPPLSPDNCLFRRRRKDARPAELLEAALTLFVEKGFAATRSEEVAKAAGVSKGTLYLYFPSKEELLKAVIQHFLGAEIESKLPTVKFKGVANRSPASVATETAKCGAP